MKKITVTMALIFGAITAHAAQKNQNFELVCKNEKQEIIVNAKFEGSASGALKIKSYRIVDQLSDKSKVLHQNKNSIVELSKDGQLLLSHILILPGEPDFGGSSVDLVVEDIKNKSIGDFRKGEDLKGTLNLMFDGDSENSEYLDCQLN